MRSLICRRSALVCFSALSMLALVAAPAAAVQRELIGPDGGRVSALAIDPKDPRVVYAGTEGGVFKSTSYGDTWAHASEGLGNLTVRTLALDPRDPRILWAGTDKGLFKTTDGGATWSPPGTGGFSGSRVHVLALDRAEPDRLYAGILLLRPVETVSLFRSDDGGESWSPLPFVSGSGAQPGVSALAVAGQTLIAGTTRGLFRSRDGGATWTSLTGIRGAIRTIVMRRRTVWAGTSEGAFRSLDLGATWTESESGMRDPDVAALLFDPTDSRVLYAGTLRRDPPRVRQPAYGIYRSTDNGNHWSPVSQAWTGRREILALAADPLQRWRIYAGTVIDGVFRSADRGATWHSKSHGLRAAWVGSVVARPGGILQVSTHRGLLTSEDHGETWQFAETGPPDPIYSRRNGGLARSLDGGVTWEDINPLGEAFPFDLVVVDPADPRHLFVSGIMIDVYSFAQMTQVWRSSNAGITWADAELKCVHASILIAAPGGHELYAGGFPTCTHGFSGGGFYRSLNGGATWQRVGVQNPIFETALALAVDSLDPAQVFADISGLKLGGTETIRALYRSLDYGSTWTRINGPGGKFVLPSLFPPGPKDTFLAWTEGLLWKSRDGGLTWALFDTPKDWIVHNVAADSVLPGVVYFATPGGLWQVSTE
jgi:photosystem II stability/assembly factor-like uncharacterized protein